MSTKNFLIVRLEKSEVLKKVSYEVSAKSKSTAIKKVNRMQYKIRDTIDEIQEDNWEPKEILYIEEFS